MAGHRDEEQHRVEEAAHDAERRLTFLYSATEALLGAAADPQALLGRLVEIAVPELADLAVAWLKLAPGRARCVAAAHFDPQLAQQLKGQVGSIEAELSEVVGLGRVLATGKSEILPFVGRSILQATGEGSERHRRFLEALGLRSYLLLPLPGGEGAVGAVLLGTATSGRYYGPEDLAFAEDLVRRAGLIIENAQAREKAETAARMRKNLLAMVSHDLRNPLNAITLNASLIQRGVSDPRVLRWLGGIQQSAGRMSTLIQDLLDLAAIESATLRLELSPCPLGQLLEEAEQAFSGLASNKGIALEVLQRDADTTVLCDPDRIQQVLSNLLGNALKFTPPGGKVTLAATAGPSAVELTVEDSGPGIPPEELRRIFHPYWQGEGRKGGVGLGLSIARGLVEAHRGRLWAESEPGKGARFHLSLPADAADGSP